MADNPRTNITRSPSPPSASQQASKSDEVGSSTDSEQTIVAPDTEQPASLEAKRPDDVPPDGGYGWVCVGCNFFINGHTWGINSSYGVFLSYYLSHNTFPNTSYLDYAFIGGLSISQALMIAPLGTYLTRRYSTRLVLHLGVFFETLSLIGASFATQKWHLFIAQGVCFGWGMGFLFVGSVGIISQWFLKKRSVANAIAAAGSGMGGLIYSLATQAMIQRLGLAWAFRILGIVTFVVNTICANLLRDRNKQVGSRHSAFHFPLIKRPEFLLFLGWGIFSMLGYVVLLFSLPNYALSVGLTAHQGSVIGALLNLGQGLGRPVVGIVSDHCGRLNIASILTFACGVFCFVIWIFAKSMGVLSFFAILVGAVAGTFWCTVSPVGAEVVGLKDLPSALSITWVMLVPPTTVAEAIALELRQTGKTNVYLHPQIFTAMVYIGAALCLWGVRAWKVGELERNAEEEKRNRKREDDERRGVSAVEKETLGGGQSIAAQSSGRESIEAQPTSSAKGIWMSKDFIRGLYAWKLV